MSRTRGINLVLWYKIQGDTHSHSVFPSDAISCLAEQFWPHYMLLHPRRKVKTGVLSFFSQMSLVVLLRSILVQVSFSQPAFGGADGGWGGRCVGGLWQNIVLLLAEISTWCWYFFYIFLTAGWLLWGGERRGGWLAGLTSQRERTEFLSWRSVGCWAPSSQQQGQDVGQLSLGRTGSRLIQTAASQPFIRYQSVGLRFIIGWRIYLIPRHA